MPGSRVAAREETGFRGASHRNRCRSFQPPSRESRARMAKLIPTPRPRFKPPILLIPHPVEESHHRVDQKQVKSFKRRYLRRRFGICGKSPMPAVLVSVWRRSLPGRTGRQVNSLASLGRLPGGIEDFSDDEVDLERRETSGLDFAANDGGEVGNLVGKGA